MNGWADGEPAWWLNLMTRPEAIVDLHDGSRSVTARAAKSDERARLWAVLSAAEANLDGYAALRSSETAVVIFEPRRS